jgi:hypothetical protein
LAWNDPTAPSPLQSPTRFGRSQPHKATVGGHVQPTFLVAAILPPPPARSGSPGRTGARRAADREEILSVKRADRNVLIGHERLNLIRRAGFTITTAEQNSKSL